MRYLVLLLLFSATSTLNAQIPVRGFLVESPTCNENGTSPLANVPISADGANQTLTNSDGSFTLIFNDKKVGEEYAVSVSKSGYTLVDNRGLIMNNSNAVQVFIMCTKSNYQAYRNVAANIVTMARDNKFQNDQLARILEKLEQEDKNSEVYQRLLKEKEAIESELSLRETKMKAMASQIAEQGWQTTAPMLLEALQNAPIPNKMDNDEVAFDEEFMDSFFEIFWSGFTEEELDSMQQSGKLQTDKGIMENTWKALFYSVDLQFEKAAVCYHRLMELDPENVEYVIEYANALTVLNKGDEAVVQLESALKYKEVSEFSRIVILNSLASLYVDQDQEDRAEKNLKKSYELCQKLIEKDTSNFFNKRQLEAKILSNWGQLLLHTNQYDAAINKFEQAKSILEPIHRDKGYFTSTLARVNSLLGSLHSTLNQYNESLGYLKQSMNLYGELAAGGSDIYAFSQYDVAFDIANLYFTRNDFKTAENLYNDLGNKFRSLVPYYPDIFREYLAKINFAEGRMAHQKRQYLLAEQKFGEALRIYEELKEKGIGDFSSNIASVLNSRGQSRFSQKKMGRAKSDFDRSLSIYSRLAEKDQANYEPELASNYSHLGSYYDHLEQTDSAKYYFEQALTISQKYDQIEKRIYRLPLIKAKQNLGTFYFGEGKEEVAKRELDEAYVMAKELVKLDSVVFMPDFAHTLMEHAMVFLNEKEYEVAIQKFQESYDIFERLSKKQPDAYELQKATIKWGLGEMHSFSEETDYLAENYLNEATQICKQQEENNPSAYQPILGQVYLSKAEISLRNKDYGSAILNFELADNIYKTLYSSTDLDEYQLNRGTIQIKETQIYVQTEEYNKAKVTSDEARRIFTRLRDNSPEDKAIYNENLALIERGSAHVNLGQQQWHDALDNFKSAQSYYQALRQKDFPAYHLEECSVLLEIGETQQELKLNSQALNSFKKVIEQAEGVIAEQEEYREMYSPILAKSHARLGDFYIQDSPGEALRNYQISLDLYEKLSVNYPGDYDYQQSMIMVNIGVYHTNQQNLNEAIGWYEKALRPFQKPDLEVIPTMHVFVTAHRSLGDIYLYAEDYDNAGRHFAKCLSVGDENLLMFLPKIELLRLKVDAGQALLYGVDEALGEQLLIKARTEIRSGSWTSEQSPDINKMLQMICELINC